MIDRRHLIAPAGSATAASVLPHAAGARQDEVTRIGFQKPQTFHALGLLPKAITVAPAVRRIEA